MLSRITLTLLACIMPLPSSAAAGVIRGTLFMRTVSAGSSKTLVTAPGLTWQRGVSEAVIYLEAVPRQVDSKLEGRRWFFLKPARPRVPRIVQVRRQFSPDLLVIPAGTRVAFQNADEVYHNTFSVSRAKHFDLGRYPPGRCDTVTFNRAGVVNLHCDIHADMLGHVVVTPNRAFTRPDSRGRYRLPKLPPGSYTVCAFHPRLGEIRRAMEVPRRGDVVLDLRF